MVQTSVKELGPLNTMYGLIGNPFKLRLPD
jgi:hypothetical protein